MWLGATYEFENDNETGIAHYKKAWSRLSSWLNVPFRTEGDQKINEEGNLTVIQRRLLEVNHHGPQALGDLVAQLKIQARVLVEAGKSSNEREEAVRKYGELLGFDASRPDNEFGMGPDAIWVDNETKTGVAFELKTQKNDPAEYSKQEVGQAHNHIQWLADNHGEIEWQGLLIIGPPGICKDEANPSDNIYLVETGALSARMRELSAKIDDTRGKTVLERHALLKEVGGLAEWLLHGWFRTLAKTPLKNLKR